MDLQSLAKQKAEDVRAELDANPSVIHAVDPSEGRPALSFACEVRKLRRPSQGPMLSMTAWEVALFICFDA
jgi:hypothetical protein